MELYSPAKINLSLAVLGRRPDGYHALDSLVGFIDFYDQLRLTPSTAPSRLTVQGVTPIGDPNNNLVMKALRALHPFGVPNHEIRLTKAIFVGAGLGGGSANAAGVLRALEDTLTGAQMHNVALNLGADVPVCFYGKPARISGIGEIVTPIADFPVRHLVLIAPKMALATREVCKRVKFTSAQPRSSRADPNNPATWRNDLEAAACGLCPPLVPILKSLRTLPEAVYSGMSGSGVCCFVVLPDPEAQHRAVAQLRVYHPDCRVRAAKLLGTNDA